MPVKPTPVTPAPAATLVLLRDRAGGDVELLLIRRHLASKFAAGDFVFPGGKIEADDNPPDAARWCAGLDAGDAARILGLDGDPVEALAFWVGAIRETFEEVGVLLARDAAGHPVVPRGPRFADYRRACQRDNRAFWEMIRGEGLSLASDALVYFAHWTTPVVQPLRFDARFFAAPLPEGQEATGDEREVTEVRWLTAREALDAQARGEISLRTPTMCNLMLFDGAPSTAAALGRLAGRDVRRIQPRVVVEGGQRRVLLPGDPGYDAG